MIEMLDIHNSSISNFEKWLVLISAKSKCGSYEEFPKKYSQVLKLLHKSGLPKLQKYRVCGQFKDHYWVFSLLNLKENCGICSTPKSNCIKYEYYDLCTQIKQV
jgi:hypothetical protein